MKQVLLFMGCMTLFYLSSSAQSFLSEGFSTGSVTTPPTGWTQNVIAGDPVVDLWHFDNPAGRTLVAPITSPAAIFDSDFYSNNSMSEDVALESPAFNTVGATLVILEFDHFFDDVYGGTINVDVFDGTAWVNVLSSSSTTANPMTESLDISAQAAGLSNAQVRFRWTGNWAFYWVVDNVSIFQPSPNDIGVASIDAPVDATGCNFLGSTESITVTIQNFGSAPQSLFALGYQVGLAGTPVIETYTGPAVPAGGTVSYTFSATADLSGAGPFQIGAATGLFGDTNNTNDTALVVVTNASAASSPYLEDFETFVENGSTTGDGTGLMNSWMNSPAGPTFAYNWSVRNGSTGSSGTGPSEDHTLGSGGLGMYMYTEASNGSTGDTADLSSSCIDLSGVANPYLSYWYHMFGEDMGTLEVFVIDGGTMTKVDSISGEQQGASGDPWLNKLIDMSAFSGNIQLMFRGIRGTSFESDMSVDDVAIINLAPVDLAVTDVTSPADFGCFGATETVTAVLTSFGTDSLDLMTDTAFVTMTLSGANTGVYTSSVDSGMLGITQTATVDFSGVDLSGVGTTDLTISVSVSGDGEASNDTLVYSLLTQPIITTYPYAEDFESGQGGWVSDGVSSSTWAFGTPAKTVITGAASGVNAWVTGGLGTGLYNANDNSAILSPCFDMTNAPSGAWVIMDIWVEAEFSWDGAVLQTSVDSGATWQNVGALGDPFNWYNDGTIGGSPGGQPIGWTGRNGSGTNGWVEAAHPLDPSLIGAADVRFRVAFGSDGSGQDDGFAFDNFSIEVPPTVDMAVSGVVSPVGFGCFGGSETVTAELTSFGLDTIDLTVDTAFVTMTLSGANTGVYTSFASTDTLDITETTTVAFTGVDLSGVGTTDLTISVSVSGDGDTSNDTLMSSLVTQPVIATYPYLEDFESGEGGWVSGGENSTWAFGTPAKDSIMGAASGVNAWVTGGLGVGFYNNNENSAVSSPCFDMTNAPTGAWVALDIWVESEFSWDGAVLQTSVDSGSTWQNVGAFGDPNNWYNDNTIGGNPGGQQEGWTGRDGSGTSGWVQASHPLDASLIGAPDVRFRLAFGSDGSVFDEGFAFDNFAIGVPPTVDLAIADSSFLCIDTSIDAGIAGGTYDWSTGESTQMINVMNNTGMNILDTSISVTVTDSLGLSGADTVVVSIYGDPPPNVTSIDVSDVLCNGDSTGSIDLTVVADAAPLTFTWDNGATSEDLMGLPVGNYNVTIADSNGCAAGNIVPFTIDEPDAIEITDAMVTDVTCPDDSTGSIMITVAGGVGGYTYSWSNGATTEDLTGLPVGSYVGTIMDSNMCVLVSSAVPIASTDSAPTASISVSPTGGGSFDFMAPVGGTSYVWNFGDGSEQDSTQNPSHTYTSNDTVVVTLTVFNDCGAAETTETVFVTAVGIADDLLSQNVRVYPNPNQGFFEIRFTELALEDVQVMLTSTDGKRVYAKALGNVAGGLVHQVSLPETTARGVYILQVRTSDAVLHKRLIVE